jgi:L-fucose isomerase-like protein
VIKAAFIGFGEVNTPREIIIKKCNAAAESLKNEGLDIIEIIPVTDNKDEKEIKEAVSILKGIEFDFIVLCIAGWIPSHAVIKVTEEIRHAPMVLWGLSGWYEGDRLVTTADQAGTSALRKIMSDLGYCFKYIYDIPGKPMNSKKVAEFGAAAAAAKKLRRAKVGMAGYRDMNLYGTLYDGASLKKVTGVEIETFEMLEIQQRYDKITTDDKEAVIKNRIAEWKFLKDINKEVLLKGAGYYIAVRDIVKERNYEAISIKDVDGMKKLLSFPPAMIFMLLAEDGICTIPENDSLGCVTQLIIKYITGQPAAYLEFYEFFEDCVLAGVPDYVPSQIVDGEVLVLPAAFGELSCGVLNVSKVREGLITLCRLAHKGDKYFMHVVTGEGRTPRKWEEAGWTQPAPQLPGLEIYLDDVEDFAEKVMSQHYIISYGDNRDKIKNLCGILGIEVL